MKFNLAILLMFGSALAAESEAAKHHHHGNHTQHAKNISLPATNVSAPANATLAVNETKPDLAVSLDNLT